MFTYKYIVWVVYTIFFLFPNKKLSLSYSLKASNEAASTEYQQEMFLEKQGNASNEAASNEY